jgi:hypothetical protein
LKTFLEYFTHWEQFQVKPLLHLKDHAKMKLRRYLQAGSSILRVKIEIIRINQAQILQGCHALIPCPHYRLNIIKQVSESLISIVFSNLPLAADEHQSFFPKH